MALNRVKTADVTAAKETVKETAPVVEQQVEVNEQGSVAQEPEVSTDEGQLIEHADDQHQAEDAQLADANVEGTTDVDTGVVLENNEVGAEQIAAAVVKPIVEDAATQQVALKEDNTAVASVTEKKKSAMQTFTQDAADQGFEGLTLTGMSFDRLKLNDKEFQLGIDETSLGNRVEFALMATRNVYIIRQHDNKGAELFYSYDKNGLTNTDGTSAQDTLDAWAEDGYGGDLSGGNTPLSVKEYIEATVQLKNMTGAFEQYDDAVVMMSIPPASKQKLGGAVAVGQMKFRKQLGRTPAIGEMLYEAKVGPKVGSGEEAFNPWVFNAIGLLPQE